MCACSVTWVMSCSLRPNGLQVSVHGSKLSVCFYLQENVQVGLSTFSAMTRSSILSQGTKILQTMQHSQKKKGVWGRAEGIKVPFTLHLSVRPHTRLSERYCVGILPNSGMYAVIGEGNGNPLQYSCLENLLDRGAWRATVHGVAKNQTQ